MPMRPFPKGAKWNKASDSSFYCPYCDTDLEENRSKMEWVYISISTLILAVGSVIVFLINEATERQHPWSLVGLAVFVLISDVLFLRYAYNNQLKDWSRWQIKLVD